MWRRGSRESQSVSGYRQTLDVLAKLGGGEREVQRHGPAVGDVPRVTSSDRPPVQASSQFDDLGTDARRKNGAAQGGPLARRDRSLHAMERPARRVGVPAAVLVLALAAGGAAAYMVVRAHHPAHAPGKSASSHSHGQGSATTLAPRYTAVSSTSSSATYAPTTPTYSLTLGATTSDCWMSVTSAAGTVVLQQTFAAGASASLSLTGHATVDIGAPNSAKMSIGGIPVVLPNGVAGPFTVTLAPA